ncbi:hypothetical protein SDC9_111386 [bioreactor metagenome]|uniref:Uncharacterized protein n=1 Tax=bioreactor metagenome TaxID=1076179 RepID=A0A645BGD3_9ZZZZ
MSKVSREVLIQVMMRVDQPRIEDEFACVDNLVRSNIAQISDCGNHAVLQQHIRAAQNGIVVIAGDDASCVL